MKLWRTLKAKKQKSKMGGHQQSKVVYATGSPGFQSTFYRVE